MQYTTTHGLGGWGLKKNCHVCILSHLIGGIDGGVCICTHTLDLFANGHYLVGGGEGGAPAPPWCLAMPLPPAF